MLSSLGVISPHFSHPHLTHWSATMVCILWSHFSSDCP